MYTGPHLIKDNLVFGYDTGYGVANNSTSTRFYPGEPTTNQADTDAKRNWGTHNGATSSTTTAPEKGPGWKKLIITNINGNNYRLAQFPYLAHANGTTRTYSVEFDVGSLTGYFMFVDGTSGYAQTNVSGKGRYSTTITASGGNKSIAIFLGKSGTHSSINHVIYYKEYQVEEKSHASPFTDSTRSDTTSLVDLKRTTNIDVSNVSFDSTGQPTFDGTNDTIQISDPNVSSSAGFSIEMIIKPSNASSSPMVITPNSGGIDHFVRFNSNGRLYMRMVVAQDSSVQDFTTTTSLSSTDYHYVVFTFKQSEGGKAYYNGSQESAASANFTALDWSSVWKIGQRGNNTFFFDGELPILKVHNQVLSANQVKQNYNAYKNRFDI